MSRRIAFELTAIAVAMSVCGILTATASVEGGRALEGLYGEKVRIFSPVTVLALQAVWWIPIFYSIVFVATAVARLRYPQQGWVPFVVLVFVATSAAAVAYGLTKPFATTTFGMGG